jgi:porin
MGLLYHFSLITAIILSSNVVLAETAGQGLNKKTLKNQKNPIPDQTLVKFDTKNILTQKFSNISQATSAEFSINPTISIDASPIGEIKTVDRIAQELGLVKYLSDNQSTQATDLILDQSAQDASQYRYHNNTSVKIAEETTEQEKPPSIWERSQLTGDWGGLRSFLADQGLTIKVNFTQYYQGLLAGTNSGGFDYGGRVDAFIDLNTEKAELWKGGGLHSHIEYRYGEIQPFDGKGLWPVNAAEILPLGGSDRVVASSLYLSQKFGDQVSLILGKINAVDLLAGDLFFGGWGTERFMNIAFVAPPSGVVPPVIMGGIAVIKLPPVALTLMVFDPNDQTNNYWVDDLFSDGVNVSLGGTYVGKIANRTTTYNLTATYSSKDSQDLGEILLPLVGQRAGNKDGSYNIAFQFSHLFYQNPENPALGWGLFLKAAIADGNPNPIQSSVIIGLGGKNLFKNRPYDSFGLGYYYYNFSNDLEESLDPLERLGITFGDEQAIELFYNFAVSPWFILGADLQYIKPARSDEDAFLAILRANIRF